MGLRTQTKPCRMRLQNHSAYQAGISVRLLALRIMTSPSISKSEKPRLSAAQTPGMRPPGSARGRAKHRQQAGAGHNPRVRLRNENRHPLQPEKAAADACFMPETEVSGSGSLLRDQRDGRILERFLVEDKTPLHLFHRLKVERGTGRMQPALPARAADNGGWTVRAADDAQHHGA